MPDSLTVLYWPHYGFIILLFIFMIDSFHNKKLKKLEEVKNSDQC